MGGAAHAEASPQRLGRAGRRPKFSESTYVCKYPRPKRAFWGGFVQKNLFLTAHRLKLTRKGVLNLPYRIDFQRLSL